MLFFLYVHVTRHNKESRRLCHTLGLCSSDIGFLSLDSRQMKSVSSAAQHEQKYCRCDFFYYVVKFIRCLQVRGSRDLKLTYT